VYFVSFDHKVDALELSSMIGIITMMENAVLSVQLEFHGTSTVFNVARLCRTTVSLSVKQTLSNLFVVHVHT
jgi:hypothetical protein